MSEPISILSQGMNCATCFFAHHWEEDRKRRVTLRPWRFWRDAQYAYETVSVSGIQCLRYPEPIDTESDHGCGEYRASLGQQIHEAVEEFAASVDTRPEGGDAPEIAAPFTSGAVGEAETPKGGSHAPNH